MVKGSDFAVDKEKCISCGACIASYDELFKFDENGKSEPIADGECEECEVSDVMGICPQSAISNKKK